jgi:hypothetical protein
MATAKKVATKKPAAKKTPAKKVAALLQGTPDQDYRSMYFEAVDRISLLQSRLNFYLGEYEKIKAERKEHASYKRWAENRILRSDNEE